MRIRVELALLSALCLLTLGCSPPKELAGAPESQAVRGFNSFDTTFVTTTNREGARQPFLLLRPPKVVASVILFTGGDGVVGISASGVRKGGNFLVNSRARFAAQDLLVAVVDPPTDRSTLNGFRTSQGHAFDIKGVIAYLREQAPVPVWLVGTSYGSVSAAKVADWLADGGGPDGVVLTSSLFVPGKIGDSVQDADPDRIRGPLLVVHHRNDRCPYTLFEQAEPYMKRMVHAQPAELIAFEGGGPVRGKYCEPLDYHGYPGIRDEVVKAIADWIKAHPPK